MRFILFPRPAANSSNGWCFFGKTSNLARNHKNFWVLMERLPNLVWLRSFEAAARHLSFTKAALQLGLTQTAVSLHVRSLEADLGAALFTRAARRLMLTQTGEAYAYSVRQALGAMAFSTASLFGAGVEQILTVRVPVSTAGLWLAHRLPEFSEAHPGITIRLVSQVWGGGASDAEPADVELRFGGGNLAGVRVRRLSTERIVPICAAKNTADLPDLETLRAGPIVQILGFEDMLLRYLEAHDLAPPNRVTRYVVDTTIAAIDIVAAGGGFGVVLERFALTAIATGKPISIMGKPVPTELAHYLLTAATPKSTNPAKQVFETWLETTLR
jgi:LysR family glycine cleavage system transcriptional activator